MAGEQKSKRGRRPQALFQDSPDTPLSSRPDAATDRRESNASADLAPHERSSITDIPVTPGINIFTYRAAGSADTSPGAHSPNYFTRGQARHDRKRSDASQGRSPSENHDIRAESPSQAIKGAMSHHEVLRRMSLSKGTQNETMDDIKAAAPDLQLSGNIISATFTTPHSLKYQKGGKWELGSRRGQSALFDGFSYLSSDEAPWNHTVVAWTGEIEEPCDFLSPPHTPHENNGAFPALTSLSAPVPFEGQSPPTPPATDGLWISKQHQLDLENKLLHDKRIRTVPVWLSDDHEDTEEGILLKDQGRWRRFAERQLYTLFHYKQPQPKNGMTERTAWVDYYRMNLKFANKIMEIYKPGDVVVVNDYCLMLLPSMLRQRAPQMYISFYLHCPFPSSEFIRCLPRRKEILEGILGANLIGFQSYSYARHFSSCCTRILDFPSDPLGVDAYGSRVHIGAFPIGIDSARVEEVAWSPGVDEKYRALKKLYAGKVILVGRDRLDSVRGVAQKLMAFERFLELYPEWQEKAVLIQVTSPTSIEEEKEDDENKIASRVNELVMRINGTYGSLGFSPVQHYPQYLARDEYFALLRAADIGLITSVRDGMNTTSLEYVVCQRDSHGPLILSEFSGTAGSLKNAIHINPWDLTDVAKQINHALTMSTGMRAAMQDSLYTHVTTQNVQSWITRFLRHLVSALAIAKENAATPSLDRTIMLEQYRKASKRLFLFDYDGTLTPIVREPSAAIPSKRVIHTLRSLASDHRNAVWIISGRDQAFLDQHLGHISELGFSAEHGSFMRKPGETTWENLAETFDMSWQADVIAVFQKYTDKVPGSFIERKRCALTWHYRQADPEQGLHMSREAHRELEETVTKLYDVDVMKGKANLEVRPTFINKGEIAKRLVREYNSDILRIKSSTDSGPTGPVEFVLCLGDDSTDEDMFRALSGLSGTELQHEQVFTVTVGASTKVTDAKWHVLEPFDVIEAVALLAGVGQSGDKGEPLSQVNLAAVAGLDGKIPDAA